MLLAQLQAQHVSATQHDAQLPSSGSLISRPRCEKRRSCASRILLARSVSWRVRHVPQSAKQRWQVACDFWSGSSRGNPARVGGLGPPTPNTYRSSLTR